MLKGTNWLMGQSYSPNVTRLDRRPLGLGAARKSAEGLPRTGPIVANDIPFTLVANEPYNVATSNEYRKGMMLQNLDAVDNLFFRFGGPPTIFSARLIPGQTLLLDFICPTSSVWVLATVNLQGVFTDMSQSAE